MTLDDVIPVIRRAFETGASADDKERAATYLRLALAALETPAGQPLTPPGTPAPTGAPVAAPPVAAPSGIPDMLGQLIDQVMARLPTELRADVERRAASDVPMLPFFPQARH